MVRYLYATDEQRELAQLAHDILKKHLQPRLAELEAAGGAFPREIVKELAKAGFCGMCVPVEFGGLGLDFRTMGMIYEEMAKIDGGFTFSFYEGCSTISVDKTAMPLEKKQAIYDGILSGDIITATAMTEADAGSDAKAIRTTATRDGDYWVINGVKTFVSNGPVADIFTINAYKDKSKGAAGIGQFIVEKKDGVKLGKMEDKLGMKNSPTCEVIFENVRIPIQNEVGSIYTLDPEAAAKLPAEGLTGHAAVLQGYAMGRIFAQSIALGMGQAAFDYALEYAKQRRQLGKRIVDHQGLGFKIADMQMKLDASRALLYYSLEALDRNIPAGTLSPTTKCFISEKMFEVCNDAIQVLGGYGYMHDYPVEKYARDVRLFSIFVGTNEINRMVCARMLAGKDPLAVKKA